jgi:hypothetical protein
MCFLPGRDDAQTQALVRFDGRECRGRHGFRLRNMLLRLFGRARLGRPLALDRLLERDEEVVAVRRGVRRDFAVDARP